MTAIKGLSEDFPFLKLSPEIRLMVYGLVLKHHEPIYLNSYEAQRLTLAASLLRVNRQVHKEAIQVLYTCNTAVISVEYTSFLLRRDVRKWGMKQPRSRRVRTDEYEGRIYPHMLVQFKTIRFEFNIDGQLDLFCRGSDERSLMQIRDSFEMINAALVGRTDRGNKEILVMVKLVPSIHHQLVLHRPFTTSERIGYEKWFFLKLKASRIIRILGLIQTHTRVEVADTVTPDFRDRLQKAIRDCAREKGA